MKSNKADDVKNSLFLLSNIASEVNHPVYLCKIYDSEAFQLAYQVMESTDQPFDVWVDATHLVTNLIYCGPEGIVERILNDH